MSLPVEQNSELVSLCLKMPEELVDDFLGKLHYVSEFITGFELISDAPSDQVRFQLLPGHEEERAKIAGQIVEVARKMCGAYRRVESKVLAKRERAVSFNDDPHPLLQARGDLFYFGQGRYGFGPRLVELLNFFDGRLLQLAESFSAEPYQFPTLIGADLLERCRYLQSFPHSLSFVSHLREDLEAIQNFARTAKWDGTRLVCDPQDVARIECLLSSAVCFHCYAWLQNQRLTRPGVFTAVGKCFRYESGNLGKLERLWDFTMRELIFVGTQEQVLDQRERAIKETTRLLDEWELSYEISSATDPFFIDEYSAATFQLAFDLKFEIQASLPYKRKTLAVGSFNFHRDYFGRSLNVSCAGGEAASTGCAAFGLERLVLAFISQHGLNVNAWPRAVAGQMKRW
jgi:seryl-tRNA synthetase